MAAKANLTVSFKKFPDNIEHSANMVKIQILKNYFIIPNIKCFVKDNADLF